MKPIKGKAKLLLYGFSGFGVNLLNLMMGSYLCSALLKGGFKPADVPFQTFAQKDLVVAAAWAAFVLVAKIIDGIIDIPMASFTDRLKSRWGRRRPTILIGLVALIASYLLFVLIIPNNGATIGNTVFFGLVLCLFYAAYTLTMVTYYATFTEVVDNIDDRNFVSNVKSVADIIYFIVGYVVVRMLLSGMNIKWVALIVLPISLTMIIPMFMIKEESTKGKKLESETVNLFKSIAYTFKNKDFILWMVVYAFMTFGSQLFLGGINEYFSYTGMSMIYVMLGAFVPVPFTLMLYNYIIKKKGFGFAFRYTLIAYSVSMLALFGASFSPSGAVKLACGILGGVICSFSIGAFFAVAYSIPSHLAAEDEKRTGIKHSAMYFAVQGLFAGVATGLATGVVLTALKQNGGAMTYLTVLCSVGCLVAFALSFILPKSINVLGKLGEAPLPTEASDSMAEATGNAQGADNQSAADEPATVEVAEQPVVDSVADDTAAEN
ncbi:MAG: MFS transporter [Clostridiales bacterium]|nr:MFS transporter [Clostridiales bacterium]